MSAADWLRVRRERPCPVCDRPDWCLIAADGAAAICARTESGKRVGAAGWLHRLLDRPGRDPGPVVRRLRVAGPAPDLTAEADCYRQSCDPDRLAGLARSLGLTVEALVAFRVGWSGDQLAWTFPMSDPSTGRVVGIRLRLPNGRKLSVKGGREGLFIPDPLDPADDGRLLIAEGPTDSAALWDMGFPAVAGRPSCTGGVRLLALLVRDLKPAEVVIVSDADAPGRAGAKSLARDLTPHVRAVRVIAPPVPHKDIRAALIAGATAADVENLIRRADPARLTLRVTTR